jgi:hypothetical protein
MSGTSEAPVPVTDMSDIDEPCGACAANPPENGTKATGRTGRCALHRDTSGLPRYGTAAVTTKAIATVKYLHAREHPRCKGGRPQMFCFEELFEADKRLNPQSVASETFNRIQLAQAETTRCRKYSFFTSCARA